MIEISVIIPTHNRADLVTDHLRCLAEQSLDPQRFEVIVSADGCTDNTPDAVRSLNVPYELSLVEKKPGTGAAGARNRGAAVAKAEILLFLDDDMEPKPGLLEAHLEAHRAIADSVVLGYYPMYPPEKGESVLTQYARLWWAERLALRSKPDYRFSFYDLCTGNVSLTRTVFENAGGFEETISELGSGEDYELGYRLIRQRVPFQFARKAETIHHSRVTLDVNMRRMKQDGFGQAIMSRKHPELLWQFNVCRLSRLSESALLRPLWKLLWKYPALTDLPMAVVRLAAKAALAMNAGAMFRRCNQLLKAHAYWRGVVAALGSLSAWERLAQDAPLEPPYCREIDFDFSSNLENLEEFLQIHGPADALRLYWAGEPVGRIAPWAGGEAFTAPYLRSILIGQYGSIVLGALVRRQEANICGNPDSTAEESSESMRPHSVGGGLN
jgi:GT2 family glycosyltransferase